MSNERILVIENDPVLLASLLPTLREEGYRASTATTGAEAIQLIRAEPPDLAIIDIGLPRADPSDTLADGLAVLSWLRWAVPGKAIPAIIYTATLSPAIKARAKASGAFAVFQKDCELRDLLTSIRAALAASLHA